MEVGANVPSDLKLQIWNNEYVDFVDLIYPNNKGSMDLTYSGGRSLTLTQKRPREIKDILQWTEAFEIFAAVYLEKPENEGKYRQLMTYVRYIRRLAARGLNWRDYDHHYRHDRRTGSS